MRLANVAMVLRAIGDGFELLIAPREAAALQDPDEAALDHPASTDDDEALHPGHSTNYLKADMGLNT